MVAHSYSKTNLPMMKLICPFWFVILLMISCGNNPSDADHINPNHAAVLSAAIRPGDCYQMIIKKDTARLSFTKTGELLEGSLSYHRAEKDKNDGNFKGRLLNDSVLLASYIFNSEGRKSVRELVFKIRDSIILQGYGEEYQRHDSAFLRAPGFAVFDSKNPFIRGCK
jgi:hypothetical protein